MDLWASERPNVLFLAAVKKKNKDKFFLLQLRFEK